MINCRKLLKIAQPFNLIPVAGKSGLNRIVSWFHYMENPEYMNWLKGNELILTTGMFIEQTPGRLLSFIEELHAHDAAGLIINLSPYITHIPKEVMDLGDFLGFPIFEMSPELRIIDISECICTAIIESSAKQNMTEHFLFGLIYDRLSITDKTLRKAVQCGYVPELTYQTVVFSLSHHNELMPDSDEDPLEMEMLKAVETRFKALIPDATQDILFFTHNTEITLLYPLVTEELLAVKVSAFIDDFEKKFPRYRLKAGISPKWQHLQLLRDHYEKASLALRFLPIFRKNAKVLAYDELDVYCLLFSVSSTDTLTDLYRKTLLPLISQEENVRTDLLHTLETYIDENSNLQRTASRLFIHVNTLRYRLHKLEQLLNCDLKDSQALFSLNLSLKIKRYVDWQNNLIPPGY